MKRKLSTMLLILVFFAGLSLLLYPSLSDYWNSFHASQAVATYSEEVRNLNADKYDHLIGEAREYNAALPGRYKAFFLSESDRSIYNALLDVNGTGVMGYIEIPTIQISLPIYHGTEDEAPTAFCLGIAAFPARSSLPIWISWWQGISL